MPSDSIAAFFDRAQASHVLFPDQIEQLIRSLQLANLEDLEFVTTYRGKPLEKGSKSVTVTLIFRSPTATLTSEQVEGAVQKAVGAAQKELGATLRV